MTDTPSSRLNSPEPVDDGPSHGSPGHEGFLKLALGSVSVVYGDIGTSPLYAMREALHHAASDGLTNEEVLGVLSLLIWALFLIITVKYVMFLLRLDNRGEGDRSQRFETSIYRRLGLAAVEDQTLAAQWLKQQPYVDADRIAIMHRGRIVRDGTPAQITADQPATIRFGTPARPLPELPGMVDTGADGGLQPVEHRGDLVGGQPQRTGQAFRRTARRRARDRRPLQAAGRRRRL